MNDQIFYQLVDLVELLCDVIMEDIDYDISKTDQALYFHVKLIDVLKCFNLLNEVQEQISKLEDYQSFNKKMFEMIMAGTL